MRLPRRTKGPLHLAVDSTGVKLYGEGEWKVRLHGADKRRTWRKLHLLIDHRTQEALACSLTEQYVLDRRELPGLLTEVEGKAREWRRQETELRVRCAALNRMTELGMPKSYAV